MANITLAYPLTVDLSGSNAPASMPVSNLLTKQPTEVFRILDPANGFISIDTGGASVDLIALLKHNGSTRGKVRVRASDTLADVESAPDYDSGQLPIRSHQDTFDTDDETGSLDKNAFVLKLSAVVTYRYWRIDIVDTVDFLDIGRLYVAKAWQPQVNAEYGLPIGWADLSRLPRASSGQVVPLRKRKFRYAEFILAFLTENEGFELLTMDYLRGSTEDVLFIKDVSNINQYETIYGLMGLQALNHNAFQLYTKSYRIEEL